MLQRNMVKCNCHRLIYLVLYYKRVIALILMNIVSRSISYCTRVQYDILRGTIFLNSIAITNHISLQHVFNIISPSCLSVVCLRANIVLLGTSLVRTKVKRLKYLVLYYKRIIALILRNIVPHSISYCTRKVMQYDILIFLNISAITLIQKCSTFRYIYKGWYCTCQYLYWKTVME
jgi:hypothetical protein